MSDIDDITNKLSDAEFKAFGNLGMNGYSTDYERMRLVDGTAEEISKLIDRFHLDTEDITDPHVLRALEDDNAHIAIDAIERVVGKHLVY